MKPKLLIFDIETSPFITYNFELYDQNIRLDQVKQDWSILAWGAKWLNDPASKTIYRDTSKQKDILNDKRIVQELIALLEQADGVITHNGDKFDIKKVNARAAIHGLPPVKPCRSTDTYKESRKVFSFTSHSLEYMSDKLNAKYKKLKHEKYPGLSLWKEVLSGNKEAWKEMKKYCINDVLATEEMHNKIQGWIKTQNQATFYDDDTVRCFCGSKNLIMKGPVWVNNNKYQGYKCKDCGKRPRGKESLMDKEKRQTLLKDGK